MKYLGVLLVGLTICSFTISCKRTDHPDNTYRGSEIEEDDISGIIQTVIDSYDVSKFFPYQSNDTILFTSLKSFYRARDYELAWNTTDEQLPQTQQFIEILENAEEEGLEREDYDISRIKYFRDDFFESIDFQKNMKLIYLDIMLTANYVLYAHHTLRGRIDPGSLSKLWKCTPRTCDYAENLQKGIEEEDIAASLNKLKPKYPQFEKLKKALAGYRNIIISGGWDTVAMGPELMVGDTSERVASAWRRINGELKSSDQHEKTRLVFDKDLEDILKQFQARYGLAQSGKLDAQTVRTMNISAVDRTRQIKLNIERMRWLPDSLGDHYILVNIPDYRMELVDSGKKALEMRVIVGQKMKSTPIFSDTMEYIVFSPYWNVPNSIATEEILPKLKNNSSYLANNHYELISGWGSSSTMVDPNSVNWKKINKENFNYRIRQKPGVWNALGHVKFIFPNDMDIYLHDTPTDHLFSRVERDFSHGCIRIEKPADLANYLLPNLEMDTIKVLMNQDHETVIQLKRRYPVQILYWTTWLNENGQVHFRDDLYRFDQIQLNAIDRHKNRELDLISQR